MKAMVLAAGVGSRLDPLTSIVPKPLVPITNVPVMEHIINLLKKHGYNNLIANLHYMPEQLIEHFGDGKRFGVDIQFRREIQLSGDAGGVRACKDFLSDGTFIIMMGDLLTDCDLTAIVAEHKSKGALASIAVKQVPDVEHFGVVVTNENGFITGFQEKPKQEEALSNLASTGIYVFEPEIFQHMPADGVYGFGRQLFPELVAKGAPVLGVEFKTYWSDVGTIAQYRQSNFDALNGLVDVHIPAERKSVNGRTVYLGEQADLHEDAELDGALLLGDRSRIGKGARLINSVVVGDDCVIEEDVVLNNVLIWSGSHVQRGARIENSIIGDSAIIAQQSKHFEVTAMAQPSPQYSCAKPAS
jgi:mannose-1-phosphate guanylyltransferase/mannose-1-phosphate guanylyltransferase/phosphomannomutase